jgi:enoyl-CoA hydratase/carnithine racemase
LLDVRRDGPICVLTFQREEKLNAISTAVERAMLDSLDGPEVREARCVIFTGGERAFSAGADLKEERDESPGGIDAYYRDTGAADLLCDRGVVPRRRLRARAGHRFPDRVRDRRLRPPRGRARNRPQLGRDVPAGARRGAGAGEGADDPPAARGRS